MFKENSRPHLILAALWLMMFSASSQVMIIPPIIPQISSELGIPESFQGMLVTAYAVMLSLFALTAGPISDKFGRRRILLIGSGAMAFALFLHHYAFDFVSLLIVRALAGAAGGVLSGASVSYIGDYFPYEKRGWANGVVVTGIAAGQILGIPIGTLLAEWGGFRQPFVMFAITMTFAFALTLLTVPQPTVQRFRGRLSVRVTFKNYLEMLKRPEISAVAGAFALMHFSIAMYVVFLPTWLTQTFDLSGYEIASVVFVGGIAAVFTGPVAGKLSDCYGRKALIIISCFGLSLVMASTTAVVSKFWIAYPLFFITMTLIAMRMSPFQALISEMIPEEKRGSLMSMLIAIGQLGMGFGGAFAGYAFMQFGYISNSVLAAVSVLAMGMMVWRFVPEPKLNFQAPIPENKQKVPYSVS